MATQEQVTNTFVKAIKMIQYALPDEEFDVKMKVNTVMCKGQLVEYSYVWISDERIINVMLGQNPDGSDRVEYVPDEDWSPPDETREHMIDRLTEEAAKVEQNSTSWADFYAVDNVEDTVRAAFTRPKIERELPPIIEFPGYEYTDEQIQHQINLDRSGILTAECAEKFGYFEISRSFVESNSNASNNKLYIYPIPDWLSERRILNLFDPFVDEKNRNSTYPNVEIKNGRRGANATVTFNPRSNEAKQIVLLCRKMTVHHPHGSQQPVDLYVNIFGNYK
jgi:hypothetical protein